MSATTSEFGTFRTWRLEQVMSVHWVSQLGQRALAAGLRPVFVGSKPYEAWCNFRGGADSMPGFVDRARIDGRMREFVWLPSVYPPKHPAQDAERGGGWSDL